MKIPTLIQFAPIVLTISLIAIGIQLVQAEVIQIKPDFQPDPLILSGESGGTQKTNCGNISAQPNHIIEVAQSLPYLRLTVESQGNPTLLIDGPEGRFCVLADSYSQNRPEISGYWASGQYSLYIGEFTKQQHTYTLSISKQKMPQK
ncbi:MAG: hypothetical protein VKN72_15425 [Nostocales cyanobacterium 94392]|nr:hypothetical protein [Nostocales cyanobacterium 94392]